MSEEEEFTLQITWQGNKVGMLKDYRPDMWYLEGTWVSNETDAAKRFEVLARNLNSDIVFNNLRKGIEVTLNDTHGSNLAVVISLTKENAVFIRSTAVSIMLEAEEPGWLIKLWRRVKFLFNSQQRFNSLRAFFTS